MEPTQFDPIADITTGRGRPGRTRRRLATGGLALALLTGSALTFNAVAGASAGPKPPARSTTSDAATTAPADTTPEATPAPAPEQPAPTSAEAEGEWVTIPLDDADLDPDGVVELLHAAGISAEIAPEGSDPWGNADMTADGGVGASTDAGIRLQKGEHLSPGTITQIYTEWNEPDGVSAPGAGQDEAADVPSTPQSIASQEAYEEAVGVRLDDDARTLSIRRGEDHPVILFVTQ